MKTKESWITFKEVIGGFIRFVVMAGLGCHIIKSQAKLTEAIYIGKNNRLACNSCYTNSSYD